MQCKERVDLLEALRQSRTSLKDGGERLSKNLVTRRPPPPSKPSKSFDSNKMEGTAQGYIGEGTIPVVNYPDLSKPTPLIAPALPPRPLVPESKGSELSTKRSQSSLTTPSPRSSLVYSPPTLPLPPQQIPRTPSPDKKGRMLTTLRGHKDGKRPSKSPKVSTVRLIRPPAASKAAGLAWDSNTRYPGQNLGQSLPVQNGSTVTVDSVRHESFSDGSSGRKDSSTSLDGMTAARGRIPPGSRTPDLTSPIDKLVINDLETSQDENPYSTSKGHASSFGQGTIDVTSSEQPSVLESERNSKDLPRTNVNVKSSAQPKLTPELPSYRNEYPPAAPSSKMVAQFSARANESGATSNLPTRQKSPKQRSRPSPSDHVKRRPVANSSSPKASRDKVNAQGKPESSGSSEENAKESQKAAKINRQAGRKAVPADGHSTSRDQEDSSDETPKSEWEARVKHHMKHLPKGVDPNAAKQIFNEIVVSGDEVHWDDVAGLEVAKKALKEAVVYPFLRPDLFMGLREPARGMLLFGPPGTGKTMLARAVATESRSTFFAISASSLTSKWLGESEKLVRALFALAKHLAPSIIFVDEIDSLLSSRGGSSEHESTRRIKTEFLIQWSDLQRAAAGKAPTDKDKQEGDATRVLVLAATNMPWAIDEAARRRFVRRQYIPLPESHVRESQLRTLLSHQKHNLKKQDIQVLVELTDGNSLNNYRRNVTDHGFVGYSGSDITALAKDAAMGPLRSLGEALLYMSMDEIRPIQFDDFEASLVNIRPSVSKEGLQEFDDWARDFGERGG